MKKKKKKKNVKEKRPSPISPTISGHPFLIDGSDLIAIVYNVRRPSNPSFFSHPLAHRSRPASASTFRRVTSRPLLLSPAVLPSRSVLIDTATSVSIPFHAFLPRVRAFAPALRARLGVSHGDVAFVLVSPCSTPQVHSSTPAFTTWLYHTQPSSCLLWPGSAVRHWWEEEARCRSRSQRDERICSPTAPSCCRLPTTTAALLKKQAGQLLP